MTNGRWLLGALLWALPAIAGAEPAVDFSTLEISTTPPVVGISTYVWRSLSNSAFAPGERLSFVIKWGVVTGGYADIDLEGPETMRGRSAYHLVSKARSSGVVEGLYKVEDRHDIWIDTQSIVTLRYDKRIREGKYRIEEHSIMDQAAGRYATASYRFDRKEYERKDGTLPRNALDSMGALYYIRTLPLEVGKSYTVDVLSADKVYPLIVTVRKRQKIKVPAGTFDCLLLEPQLRSNDVFISKGKKLEVWVTDDVHHVPVRMRSEVMIGHVSAELLPAKNPDH